LISQGGLTAVAFLLLRDVFVTPEALRLLFESTAVTVGYMTLITFVFVKVLFLKSSGVLDFTRQLPTTNRERSAALLLFESTMVLLATAAVVAPLSIATMVLTGWAGGRLLLSAVVYPMFVAYLLLAVGYNLLTRLLLAMGLARGAQLLTSTVFAALIFAYNARANAFVGSLASVYLDGGTVFTGINAFLMLDDRFGAIAAAAAFIVGVAVAIVLVTSTAPSVPLGSRRFLRVPVPGIGGPAIAVYVAAMFRRWETWFAAVLALGTMVYLIWVRSAMVAYASGFLLFEGIFVYVATRPISDIGPVRTKASARLWLMMGAQGLVVLALSAPISLAALAVGNAPQTVATFYGVAASAIIVLTLVGIALPPEKDNPFSVFLGLAIAAIVVGILLLMVGLLTLPPAALVAVLVGGHLLLIYYSMVGIQSLEGEMRHEGSNVSY
jgi:hypothetical protein